MNTMTGMDVGNEPEEGPPAVSMAPPSGPGELAALELVDGGFLDLLFDKVDAGELRLTGEGGFIPTMIKAVLERGLEVELAEWGVSRFLDMLSLSERMGSCPKRDGCFHHSSRPRLSSL